MQTLCILPAVDEIDDFLFKDVLDEFPLSAHLVTVRNGEQLMQLLNTKLQLSDLLFPDLNMPCKNGFKCLSGYDES